MQTQPEAKVTIAKSTNSPVIDDPAEVRRQCREGRFTGLTAGQAPRHAQANLVMLPKDLAYDFLVFCQRNPKPCPLLEVTDPGNPEPTAFAPGADLRSDLPRYRVFRDGELVDEPTDVSALWRDDMVAFLIGCSYTFEEPMAAAGLPLRHIEEGGNVPMYKTSRACRPAGPFQGPMVVSMRPMSPDQAEEARRVTAPYHRTHGAPVHIGEPEALGIADLERPDYGDTVSLLPGEVPVFWACGVTPQAAMINARPELAITHSPGHMFVSDATGRSLLE